MRKMLLFETKSLYRDSMKVYGYLFGGEDFDHCRKTLAVVGGMRGNEFTQMYEAAQVILNKKMSVREAEAYVKQLQGDQAKIHKKKEPEKDPMILDLESRMSSRLGTKVTVSGKNLSIHFTDTDDLNRILEQLGMLEESRQE